MDGSSLRKLNRPPGGFAGGPIRSGSGFLTSFSVDVLMHNIALHDANDNRPLDLLTIALDTPSDVS